MLPPVIKEDILCQPYLSSSSSPKQKGQRLPLFEARRQIWHTMHCFKLVAPNIKLHNVPHELDKYRIQIF
jgi:hypothetical protein